MVEQRLSIDTKEFQAIDKRNELLKQILLRCKSQCALNAHERNKFISLIGMYPDGLWSNEFPDLYKTKYGVELCDELKIYGYNHAAYLIDVLAAFGIFKIYVPKDYKLTNNNFLICNFKNDHFGHILYDDNRRYDAIVEKEDLVTKLKKISEKFLHKWTSTDCINSCTEYGFSFKNILLLLWYYEIIQLEFFEKEIFIYFNCIFELSLLREWNNKECKYSMIDLKYKYDYTLQDTSKLVTNNIIQDVGNLKDNVAVFLVGFNNPTSPSAILYKNVKTLQDLQRNMIKFYRIDEKLFQMKSGDAQPGNICVVKFDRLYQRGLLKEVSETSVIVYILDFGFIKQFQKDKIFYMHSMFTILPKQAITLNLNIKLKVEKSKIIQWYKHNVIEEIFYVDLSENPNVMLYRIFESEKRYLHEEMKNSGLVKYI